MPFLSFDVSTPGAGSATLAQRRSENRNDDGEDDVPKKGWFTYVPLGVLLFIVFVPQPSYLITLTSFYIKTHHAPWRFGVHLLAVEALTLCTLSSLLVCLVRDPGVVGEWDAKNGARNNGRDEAKMGAGQKKTARVGDGEDGATTSLLRGGGESYDEDVRDAEDGDEDAIAVGASSCTNSGADVDMDTMALDGRWCARCKHARPERAHHCGACGRCVLKMDHHCPWLGGNCVGHRTYPAFIHFLLMGTLLAAYIACVSLSVVVYLVTDPFSIDPHTSPLHALFLLFMGAVFALTMGSFLLYHVYLVSTNQTTVEHVSPFLLLRYIPPPPSPHTTPPSAPLVDTSAQATPALPESQMPLQLLDPEQAGTTIMRTYRPPDEHDLSPAQRRVATHVHGEVRLYDLGFRRNWGEVFGGGRGRRGGWPGWWRWVGGLVLCGGRPRGDGRTFERGKGAEQGMARLVRGLEDVRKSEGRGWMWAISDDVT